MIILKNLCLWFKVFSNIKVFPHLAFADSLLSYLMKNGAKVVTYDSYYIYLTVDNKDDNLYALWYRNRFCGSFQSAMKLHVDTNLRVSFSHDNKIYRYSRPSRIIEYKFYKYLQESNAGRSDIYLSRRFLFDRLAGITEFVAIVECLKSVGINTTVEYLKGE